MDLMSIIASIPGIGPLLPYLALTVALASAIAPFLAPPKLPAKGRYAMVYGVVNFLAINVGKAKNAGAPGTPPLTPAALLMFALSLPLMPFLAACTTPPTATQTATLITAGTTLADLATANNATVAALVTQGALFCQKLAPATPLIVAIANVEGVPLSVTNQSAAAVAAVCALAGGIPVAAPATPATTPVVVVPTATLPPAA